eukprot:scaffold2388_cov237-Pinguiococcus_pyrenoidosus.AAC.3
MAGQRSSSSFCQFGACCALPPSLQRIRQSFLQRAHWKALVWCLIAPAGSVSVIGNADRASFGDLAAADWDLCARTNDATASGGDGKRRGNGHSASPRES